MLACPDVPYRAAVEYLVSAGFEPARTLVLAFGFDEESTGTQVRIVTFAWHRPRYRFGIPQGAGALSEYLLATFGRNAFALIVDEGGMPAVSARSRVP